MCAFCDLFSFESEEMEQDEGPINATAAFSEPAKVEAEKAPAPSPVAGAKVVV